MITARHLGETRTELAILGESFPQSVEPFGDGFARATYKRLRAKIHLDAGNDLLPDQAPRTSGVPFELF